MSANEDTQISLKVNRKRLRDAIRVACTGLGSKPAEIRLEHVGGELVVSGLGTSTSITAEGAWPGTAFVSAQALRAIASKLPSREPLKILVKHSRFYIEGWSVPARWQDLSAPAPDLPLNTSPLELLAFAIRFPDAVIVSSSAGPAIEKARADLIARTQAASEKLKWYGITAESLAEFVNGVIRSAAKRLWP